MDKRIAIQEKLNAFYLKVLKEVNFNDEQREQLSKPLLISVPQAYLDAPLRVMFIGKETNGWKGKLSGFDGSQNGIEQLLARYDKQMDEPASYGAFTRMHHHIAATLTDGRKESVLWNNLMKMDWYQGKTSGRNSLGHSEELHHLSRQMLKFEVELLQPHVMLFGSGPRYDSAIKATFPIQNSRRIVPRALWAFESNGTLCYRMRHPQARVDKNKVFEPVEVYYNRALDEIKEKVAAKEIPQPPYIFEM